MNIGLNNWRFKKFLDGIYDGICEKYEKELTNFDAESFVEDKYFELGKKLILGEKNE